MCQFNRVITSTTIVSVLHFNIVLHSTPLFLKFFLSFQENTSVGSYTCVFFVTKYLLIKLKYSTLPALKAISEPIIGLLNSVTSAKISSRRIVSYILISSASVFSAVSYVYKQFSSKTLRACVIIVFPNQGTSSARRCLSAMQKTWCLFVCAKNN